MEWTQLLILIVTISGLFLWSRSESRNDWRHMDAKIEANLQAIREEMKDFHGRLEKIDADHKAGLRLIEEKYYSLKKN